MGTQNLALFDAIGAKMDYLNQRQRVISQNISNADTPGYRPKDLVEGSFDSVLKGIIQDKNAVKSVYMDTTDEQHLPPPNQIADPKSQTSKHTYEVAPAGNAVIIEEQLINSNHTIMDYNMMVNLMQKNKGLINTALGRGQ